MRTRLADPNAPDSDGSDRDSSDEEEFPPPIPNGFVVVPWDQSRVDGAASAWHVGKVTKALPTNRRRDQFTHDRRLDGSNAARAVSRYRLRAMRRECGSRSNQHLDTAHRLLQVVFALVPELVAHMTRKLLSLAHLTTSISY
eukprot:6199576-Pleurochrysis_carterae.AAC.4